MSFTDKQIREADAELYELYRGGSTNQVRIRQLWGQIDVLESKKKQEEAQRNAHTNFPRD